MIKKLRAFGRSGAILSFLGALLLIGGMANAWVVTHTHIQNGFSVQGEEVFPTYTGTYYTAAKAPTDGDCSVYYNQNQISIAQVSAEDGVLHCASGTLQQNPTTDTHLVSQSNITSGTAYGYGWDNNPNNKVPTCPGGGGS